MKPKILIVDDEALVRDFISEVLIRMGYAPLTAESGESAVEYLEQSEFDVVITDFLISFESVPIRPDGSSPLTKDISETKEINLGPNQNDLDFQFASLNYLNSSKNEYAYTGIGAFTPCE